MPGRGQGKTGFALRGHILEAEVITGFADQGALQRVHGAALKRKLAFRSLNQDGSLKSERVLWRNYQTRFEARADIVEYFTMFYNSRRLHSYLGYQSPDQFERNGQLAKAA